MVSRTFRYGIAGILVLAAALRLIRLGEGDTLGDEVFLAFRAVGPMDYTTAAFQTTPWEWFDRNIPSWAKLSFHDHPPLVIWTQHLFMRLFGETPFSFRLPSALMGILSVYFLYFLGKTLYGRGAGLLAAGLLTVTANHVFISRVGLHESYVIAALLLGCVLMVRALREEKSLPLAFAAFGVAVLFKYTAVVGVPIMLTGILLFRKQYIFRKPFWIGVFTWLLIISPIVFYNVKLYQAVGHFDFQVSYLLGQDPPEWREAPGRTEYGSFEERLGRFLPNMLAANSWLFLGLFIIAAAGLAGAAARSGAGALRDAWLPASGLFWIALLTFLTGPAPRFLALLTPFFALLIGAVFPKLLGMFFTFRIGPAFAAVLGIMVFEVAYAANSELLHYPKGSAPLTFSSLRYETYAWGYRELDRALDKEFARRMPAVTLAHQYQFVEDARKRSFERAEKKGFLPLAAVLVPYGNFQRGAALWVLERRSVYEGWPILSFKEYLEDVQTKGVSYYREAGIERVYIIMETGIVPEPEFAALLKGESYESIRNARGDEAFRIYRLRLAT